MSLAESFLGDIGTQVSDTFDRSRPKFNDCKAVTESRTNVVGTALSHTLWNVLVTSTIFITHITNLTSQSSYQSNGHFQSWPPRKWYTLLVPLPSPQQTCSVDDYESKRCFGRRPRNELRLSFEDRREILSDIPDNEVKRGCRRLHRDRKCSGKAMQSFFGGPQHVAVTEWLLLEVTECKKLVYKISSPSWTGQHVSLVCVLIVYPLVNFSHGIAMAVTSYYLRHSLRTTTIKFHSWNQ